MNIFLLSLLACAVTPLFGREQALSSGDSPDKHLHVFVVEKNARISYQLRDTRSGATVLSLPSSYRPDDANDEWAFQQSIGAEVYWRHDSRCVAIEEANYRRIGTVLIARRTTKAFRQVPVNDDALMTASKQPWERGRLFFGKWGRRDTVILNLIGLVQRVPGGQRDEFEVTFTLDIAKKGDVLSIDVLH